MQKNLQHFSFYFFMVGVWLVHPILVLCNLLLVANISIQHDDEEEKEYALIKNALVKKIIHYFFVVVSFAGYYKLIFA